VIEPRLPRPKLREEFRRELRARLMTEAVTALAPRPRGTAWTFLRPALAVGIASLVLVGGAGVAAAGSLPGDLAFGLKRAAEDLQVSFTFDDVQRVQLLAQLADRRVQDLQKVAESEREVRAAVDAVQQAAPADKADQVQDLVDTAREKHEAVLDQVQQKLENEKAREAIERARDEEDRDTHDEQNKKGLDPRSTPRPTHTPARETARPNVIPRVTESPRSGERTASPRATSR